MSIEIAHQLLGWPSREQILAPHGSGPRVFAELAQEKLGQTIRRRPDVKGVNVGVLTADPESNATQAPIAIVCEFKNKVSSDTIRETHALAWNFCRSPLLITIEPHLLRAWTCYEPPAEHDLLSYGPDTEIDAEIHDARIDLKAEVSLSQQAGNALHWVQLISGQFFRDRANRFKRDQRADQMLLDNLKFIRQKLHTLRLSYEVIHDLLARIIFIQFLFQRKDTLGRPALNDKVLRRLHNEGVLSAFYRDLGSILSNYEDTYRFFQWLNNRFNGDLFPGKGATEKEREAEWEAEMRQVKTKHLNLLADFVSGRVQMEKGQWCLWQRYAFDAIPLEFISSIYEVFVNQDNSGVHYTRTHVVDFMLDGVLSWDGEEWDLRILDPACGSGIFLVKAFQRLVQRWKNANPGYEPTARLLQRLLENNLFGIDIDPHAVRVASFSLYLAMCDEIDPRWYWQRVRFPRLRDRQVVHADFFYEDKPLFSLHQDTIRYDLIIGNAPWGHTSITAPAKSWAQSNNWETAYNDIGPLFLPKAASLVKQDGHIVMIQPTGGIISNQVATAKKFRQKLFREYKVEEVVNLSTLRFILFPTAISPACIVTMRPSPPDGEPFTYICPKPTHTNEDDYRIVIEPHDINMIYPDEGATDPWIWSALMWGGRRDLSFVRQLGQLTNIVKLRDKGIAKTRQGIIRGDKKKRQKEIVGRRVFDAEQFPDNTFLYLDAADLRTNDDPRTDSKASTDFSAFELPQMVIKQSWQQGAGRFRAVITQANEDKGVICSGSYISVHVPKDGSTILEAACLSYNSNLAVYYLLLSSPHFGSYRPKPNVQHVLSVPIPEPRSNLLQGLQTFDDVDRRAYQAFSLKASERILIEDLINYTLPDFVEADISSPGRQRTSRIFKKRSNQYDEPELIDYCENFIKVLKAGFGQDKEVCATIFQDTAETRLPVRLVAIHLDWPGQERVRIERIDSSDLWNNLQQINEKFLMVNKSVGGILYQRVARLYDTVKWESLSIPTIYLIKPDQIRYWLRSTAQRDADDVAADIMNWHTDMDNLPGLVREEQLV